MSARFGIGWMEIAMIMTVGVFLMTMFITIFTVVMRQLASQRVPTGVPSQKRSPAEPQAASERPSSYYVARIIQRFCPRCRTPLAADAPEGLCPACLMSAAAGGSSPASGTAVTTPVSGASADSSVPTLAELQEQLPQFEILELLGRGGMGAVYKARQKNLDRIIALKVIPPQAAKDPAFAERFAREARALARLNHPNIVTVHDFGQSGDLYYLVMEYIDGVNLRHAQSSSRLSPEEALAIVPQICDALQYAHDQGIVHRDIKPENVLLDRAGRVKIADFGLAKMLAPTARDFTLTGTQQVMGTLRYMAPEQMERPTTVDHRADIYSLGVMIYEMLTGELPLGRFQPPSEKVAVDVRIDQVVLRALEKAPERRYQQASHVKTDLASAAPPHWQPPAPALKHHSYAAPGQPELGPLLAVAIGMVLGVLTIGAGIAAGIYGVAVFPIASSPWWGCMGAAFGCIVGGFGSIAGSYNTYRQLAGAEDLMRSPHRTWLDWTLGGYFVFGLLLMLTGAFTGATNPTWRHTWQPLLILSIIIIFQSVLFLLFRALLSKRPP